MTRLRGPLDALVLLAFALVAIPWCLVAPRSWERALDGLGRHVLFHRRPATPGGVPR